MPNENWRGIGVIDDGACVMNFVKMNDNTERWDGEIEMN